jgi:hypothetical protein
VSGIPGSGSPELEILAHRKCDDFEGSGSDLRRTLFQGSIIPVRFFRAVSLSPMFFPSLPGFSYHCSQYGGKNRVKSGFYRVITVFTG